MIETRSIVVPGGDISLMADSSDGLLNMIN